MPTVLEEIKDVQFITNKDGEKTAIVIPLDESNRSFRRLLAQHLEEGDYKNVGIIVAAVQILNDLKILIESINDTETLGEVSKDIELTLDAFEDRIDFLTIEARKGEPTISHQELTEELKRDGIL
ncbi:MAG: hypothetical protein WA584_19280 [Pyrinomonadaceae bacterium]